MFDYLKNKTVYANKYRTNSDGVIISCFFNPQNSPYRLKAFEVFYESIKHLNHRIIECVIGDTKPQLDENKNIKRIHADTLLWHKESILNKIVSELPAKYKYVFWIDADVIFTNLDWLVDSCNELKTKNIIQPFEYCVHLAKDETVPSFDLNSVTSLLLPNSVRSTVWRSFCSNYVTNYLWHDVNYNNHGHVGFAWGARREVLDLVPLYDRALIGGADHIIAHAAAGQIPHSCITKSFSDDIDEVNKWSRRFYDVVRGKIGYVKGNLYHMWHGDIDKREYLKRIREFTPRTKQIKKQDKNGLYVADAHDEKFMKDYFQRREVCDDGFLTSMALGYLTDSTLMGTLLGGNMMGAAIGDMLNNSDDKHEVSSESTELAPVGPIQAEADENFS